jgi:hypothetical protein
MDNIYLKLFLEHHYRKNPVYISNNEIEEFLITNREALSKEDFLSIKNYFINELNLKRYVFKM